MLLINGTRVYLEIKWHFCLWTAKVFGCCTVGTMRQWITHYYTIHFLNAVKSIIYRNMIRRRIYS